MAELKGLVLCLSRIYVSQARLLSEANRIMADSLGGPDNYLRWAYIDMLKEPAGKSGRETIYIPTEAGMPVLEAGRVSRRQTAE